MENWIQHEQHKIGGKTIGFTVVKTPDYRNWLELEPILSHVFCLDDDNHKEIIKHVPKPYFKKFEVKGVKVQFIDRLALGMIVNRIDNYDAYMWAVKRCVGDNKKYSVNVLCDALNHVSAQVNNIPIVTGKIKEADASQQNILHKLENEDLTDKELAEIAKVQQDLRRKRRKNKNEFAVMSIGKTFIEQHGIKPKAINDMSSKIKGLENLTNKKLYNERKVTYEELKCNL